MPCADFYMLLYFHMILVHTIFCALPPCASRMTNACGVPLCAVLPHTHKQGAIFCFLPHKITRAEPPTALTIKINTHKFNILTSAVPVLFKITIQHRQFVGSVFNSNRSNILPYLQKAEPAPKFNQCKRALVSQNFGVKL